MGYPYLRLTSVDCSSVTLGGWARGVADSRAEPENMAPSMRCSVGTRGILRSWLHLLRGWETRALPFAGMRCSVGTWLRPKGAAAYQPGVQLGCNPRKTWHQERMALVS
ncbi:MAG: hypothetical protein KGQ16_14810 [Cyanobacteria bacterium REEB444]|nr:hypothetical protein [Cyanobacteria bacterium REEB444]